MNVSPGGCSIKSHLKLTIPTRVLLLPMSNRSTKFSVNWSCFRKSLNKILPLESNTNSISAGLFPHPTKFYQKLKPILIFPTFRAHCFTCTEAHRYRFAVQEMWWDSVVCLISTCSEWKPYSGKTENSKGSLSQFIYIESTGQLSETEDLKLET